MTGFRLVSEAYYKYFTDMKRYKDTDLCQFFSKVSKVTECLDENETTIYLDYFYDYSLQDRCPYLLGYREIEMGFIRLLFTTIHKTISEFTDKLCLSSPTIMY